MTIFWTVAAWALGLPLTFASFCAIFLLSLIDRSGRLPHLVGVLWSRVLLVISGVSVEARGLENMPRGRPVIILSNHQGAFDIPALQSCMPIQFRWVAKKSLFRIPVLGWAMSLSGYIPVDRDNPTEAMRNMEEAAAKIRGGTSVLVFPEGTRSATGQLLPFKRGAFMLASRSGVPIVPVAIRGTSGIMKKGGFMIRPARVVVSVGRPIAVTGQGSEKDLRNAAKKAIEALFNEGMRVSA